MNTPPTRALVLDHDGVLGEFDYRSAISLFGRLLPIDLKELGSRWNVWLKDSLKQGPEAITWPRFCEYLGQSLSLPADKLQELKQVNHLDLFLAFPNAREELEKARGRGLRIAVLSNTPLVDLWVLLRHLKLHDAVDVVVDSQLEGVFKPDARAYLRVLERLNAQQAPGEPPVKAGECVFLDDEPANVAGAVAVGMRAYRVDRRRAAPALEENVLKDLSDLRLIT